MKFLKWFAFTDEGSCEKLVRAEYRQFPDKRLSQIDPSGLTPLGLKVYREEIARRKTEARDAAVASPGEKSQVA